MMTGPCSQTTIRLVKTLSSRRHLTVTNDTEDEESPFPSLPDEETAVKAITLTTLDAPAPLTTAEAQTAPLPPAETHPLSAFHIMFYYFLYLL